MDRRSSAATTAVDDPENNPGAAFLVFIEMEKVSEKLKLLEYDKEFVFSMKMRPLHKYNYLKSSDRSYLWSLISFFQALFCDCNKPGRTVFHFYEFVCLAHKKVWEKN